MKDAEKKRREKEDENVELKAEANALSLKMQNMIDVSLVLVSSLRVGLSGMYYFTKI